MVTLKDEISSQENMEQWMSQLGHPENPISNKGVLVRLQPQFVSCDFEKRFPCPPEKARGFWSSVACISSPYLKNM